DGDGPVRLRAIEGRVKCGIFGSTDSSYIMKDVLPGSYPKTLEEQVTIAKKYNMQMEDEEPWLDDGMGYGNYLKFPDSSQQERDPWCDWDHPDLMLNWGEPRLWGLGVYIRKRMDVSSMPVSWNLTCKQLHSFTAFMTFMFWVWGELYHSPGNTCLFKMLSSSEVGSFNG
uniref:Uncharacterized protein n=1 Tax=Bos mutus grunniens TaxID=30521 RepID=A0A8B9YQ50_BOSMU